MKKWTSWNLACWLGAGDWGACAGICKVPVSQVLGKGRGGRERGVQWHTPVIPAFQRLRQED